MRSTTVRAAAVAALVGTLGAAAPGAAQVRIDDLVVTAAMAGEGYEGNLASATVPVVDSTDHARAAVGELGIRGAIFLLERSTSAIQTTFDFGMRQFAASGFEVRDYAPREWAGRATLRYDQSFQNAGILRLQAEVQGRSVDDRPPMPLFLQPGLRRVGGSAAFETRPVEGVRFDLSAGVESSNYEAPRRVTTVDLLDRDAVDVELGAAWDVGFDIRFYTGFRSTEYPRQGTSLPSDPFRRDRTIRVGAEWGWEGAVVARFGVEGIVNRSNSRRPEYDAFRTTGQFAYILPWGDLGVNLYGVLTGKTYVHATPFVRLVPGEEADNASLLFLDINRPVAPNLDAALRFGFTRAETDIGDSYYERYGVTFLLNYRPRLP